MTMTHTHRRSVVLEPPLPPTDASPQPGGESGSQAVGFNGRSEDHYRRIFHHATAAISLLSMDGVVLEANARWAELLGRPAETMLGQHYREFTVPHQETINEGLFRSMIARGTVHGQKAVLRHADGSEISMEFSFTVTEIDGQPTILSVGHDITEQVSAARSLASAEERYRLLVERLPDVIWTCSLDGVLTFITPNALQVCGNTAAELQSLDLEQRIAQLHPDDRGMARAAFRAMAEDGRFFDIEYRRINENGKWLWFNDRVTAAYERNGRRFIDGMITNITEKKRLEASLLQGQRMEAIGQLTGGIAHDFNNILAAILANAHFLLEDLPEQDPRRSDASEIRLAAERASALTRQLLAFSRLQMLEPATIGLGRIVTGIEPMLKRVIGEDVRLCVKLGESTGNVRVDVCQIEQVIMNLVVNARDAMPIGGLLTIETANIEILHGHGFDHLPLNPGPYVVLAVTDSGCGMNAETVRRAFEPFFTTKEVGRGTGLGLSTCYGIIKQSGGHIDIYSEVNRGTSFKVYLPRLRAAETEAPPVPRCHSHGSETILLVEDDPRVRSAVLRILISRGYRVIEADCADRALEAVRQHEGPIHLVLSDVVMPGTDGPRVVAALQQQHPDLRALFMSGYPDHALLREGALSAGTACIQKPFTPDALAQKVREVLDV